MDDRDKATRLRLAPQFGRLAAEVTRLRLLLAGLEWCYPTGYMDGACPVCGGWESKGHAPDCRLKAALDGR